MASVGALYTPEVLALATGLAALPFDPAMALQGSARSASCGSRVDLSLAVDGEGRIERLGLRAQACAIGQAAAAIFAGAAAGHCRGDLSTTLVQLEAWLAGTAPLPEWPGLAAIAAAQAFPGRHGAILLPWKAALHALPSAESSR